MDKVPPLTGWPRKKAIIRIFVVAFCLFFNSASTMYLYSFLPYMMVDFGMAETKTQSGKYASWLASGYFLGRFAASTPWGHYIDQQGRKKGLLLVLFCVSTLTLVFGFVTDYWVALAIRVITGTTNGLSIIGKVLTTEGLPEDLKVWSISIISSIWSLGMTCGPFIGSMFYMTIPSQPYLASALVMSGMGYLLLFLAWLFVDETLHFKNASQAPQSDDRNKFQSINSEKEILNSRASTRLDDSRTEDGETALIDPEEEEEGSPKKMMLPKEKLQIEQPSKEKKGSFIQNIKQISGMQNVPKLIGIFSINTFYAAVIGELIPFWVAAQYEDGGLGFNYEDVAQVFLYLTPPQIIVQIFLYPYLKKRKGDFWLVSRGHWFHIPMFFFIPYAHWFPKEAILLMKLWLVFWMFVRNLASAMNFASIQRFTNDCTPAKTRGTVNGVQITASSLLQSTGPFLGGWVLSWSMENGLDWPLNYHFVYLLMVIITILAIKLLYSLEFQDAERSKLKGEESIDADDNL